jgi:hypothetical protein
MFLAAQRSRGMAGGDGAEPPESRRSVEFVDLVLEDAVGDDPFGNGLDLVQPLVALVPRSRTGGGVDGGGALDTCGDVDAPAVGM